VGAYRRAGRLGEHEPPRPSPPPRSGRSSRSPRQPGVTSAARPRRGRTRCDQRDRRDDRALVDIGLQARAGSVAPLTNARSARDALLDRMRGLLAPIAPRRRDVLVAAARRSVTARRCDRSASWSPERGGSSSGASCASRSAGRRSRELVSRSRTPAGSGGSASSWRRAPRARRREASPIGGGCVLGLADDRATVPVDDAARHPRPCASTSSLCRRESRCSGDGSRRGANPA
jgi:hypothetical protein